MTTKNFELPQLIQEKSRELSASKKERVAKEFEEMQVEPGESVGLVAAESIGEPGTQMSLDYNEKVIVKSSDGIKNVKIGSFVDAALEIFGKKKLANPEQTEVFELPEEAGFCVPGLNKEEKLEWKKITALSRHKAPEKLLQISTRSGRRIVATPYHSFLIRANNTVVPVAGEKLKAGERIPVVKQLSVADCKNYIKMEDFLPKEKHVYGSELKKAMENNSRINRTAVIPLAYEQINNYANASNKVLVQKNCVYPVQNHGTAQIPELMPLNAAFGWLIGAYLAEGTHTENYVAITNTCPEYLARSIEFANTYSINYKIRYEMGEYGKSTSVLLYSTLLAKFLNTTCSRKSGNKHIPEFAYSANPEFISNLLQAYFDGDGSISVTRNVIRASSNSKKLIDGIALLLSRLGIFSSKSSDKKGQYWLSISYRYSKDFLDKIGLVIPSKRSALIKLSNKLGALEKEDEKSYDIIEMIPGYGNLFLNLGKKLKLPGGLVNKFTKKQKIGKCTLERYKKYFEGLSEDRNINIGSELALIKQMLNADVVWDEILNLEYVKPSSQFVYDFSVDGSETFAVFDGIITHNTLNTFHFAGVSELNITMGLPRIIEILDGQKTLKTPTMEIYLKKPYSQGKDIREVALSIKDVTLKDIVSEFSITLAEAKLEVFLDTEKMKALKVTNSMVEKALKFAARGFNTSEKDNVFSIKSRKEDMPQEIYNLKERIKDTHIRGIAGISQVLPIKRGDEFIIITAGTNLKKVLELPEVDGTRTVSNDIFETESVLGIEAARQAIINEVYKVMENQGLNVDIRHLMLIADTMCNTERVRGITRYGVVKDKSSVLARASFETPIRHIINASLTGENDKLSSVIENVMLNQPVPVGTGLPGLVTKVRK